MREGPINRWLIDLICGEHNTPLFSLWPQSLIVLCYQKNDFEVSCLRSPLRLPPYILSSNSYVSEKHISGFTLIKIERKKREGKDSYWESVGLYSPGALPDQLCNSENFFSIFAFSFKPPCLIAMAFLIKNSGMCGCLFGKRIIRFFLGFSLSLRRHYLPSIWLMSGREEPAGGLVDICPSLTGFLRVCD